MPAAGAHVRDYEVWGRLSEGGMSEVWLAKHAVLLVPVILKTLRATVVDLDSSQGFSRMLNEARLMARIPSPKVVRALDAGVHEGIGYVVQEYVDGIDLAELDRERRRALGVGLPLWFVCSVMHDICLALHASHQTGILHRDVKPSNVFGSPQTGIRLGDFGIAIEQENVSVPTEISGTFKFMAPEQLRGDPLDRAADVYGAGATAFDLRYGHPPFLDIGAALDPVKTPDFPEPAGPAEAYFQHVVQDMLRYEARERPRALADLGRHFGFIGRSMTTPAMRTTCVVVGKHKLRLGDCEITFDVGNIADASADGIVNSAHDHMRMRTGVGEALRVKGGDAIEEVAMKGGHQALGTCIATPAGKLDARHVLHAVSAWNEVSCVGRAAYRTFLVAENLGLRSLAIPALGTGASRVSYETSAGAIATALRHHLVLGGSRLRRVTFVLRDDQVRNVFREVAEEALRDADRVSPTYDVGLPCDGEVRPEAATHVRASEPDVD
jgi:O-acetyl-ADP-ribose deacetylase (regulator of RNase III)/tRNA A-37 threonylcarbamoyl transferase component Bud32